ncbi:MAG: hypothetical protein ABJA98_01795 [Acidobacteriota bacterium]
MTREHRLVLSLDEITAVRWQCPICHVAISYALTETIRLPDACPSCHDPLDGQVDATTAARAFIQAVKAVRRGAPLLYLELVDPEA